MPRTIKSSAVAARSQQVELEEDADLGAALAKSLAKRSKPVFFQLWIVGDTPLIVHAWSLKGKGAMLAKQVKATRDAQAPRNPDGDFRDSLYRLPDGRYGFPAMAFKKAILSAAHKDKGIARTSVLGSLWVEGEMVRLPTAHGGPAICDMPLVVLHSGEPEMREDMVRVGQGLQKTASLAYRGQFTHWAVLMTGRINPDVVPLDALRFLVDEAGFACGVGDWRTEKNGMFGAFHIAGIEEARQWDAYVAGKAKLPVRREILKEAA